MLTKEEETQLVELLGKLSPGFYPEAVFQMFSKLTVSPIIEVVPFRKSGGQLEILLFKRPDDDPVWPSQLHVPGTVVRPTDTSFQDAFGRISNNELGVPFQSKPVKVLDLLHHSGRGMEVAQVFAAELKETSKALEENFYSVNNLPNIINSQMDFIPQVIKYLTIRD